MASSCRLGSQRVWPPIRRIIIDRGARDLLKVAPIRVGGVDAFLPGARAGSGEQSEDDLRAVGGPVGLEGERQADGCKWNLRQAGAVRVDDEEIAVPVE